MLSNEQEEELLDWIIVKNSKGEAPNGADIIHYCEENFDWEPQRAKKGQQSETARAPR